MDIYIGYTLTVQISIRRALKMFLCFTVTNTIPIDCLVFLTYFKYPICVLHSDIADRNHYLLQIISRIKHTLLLAMGMSGFISEA